MSQENHRILGADIRHNGIPALDKHNSTQVYLEVVADRVKKIRYHIIS